jgi:hypothetical protein
MELDGIGNVSDHINNLHGNWLHLHHGRNRYRVYVGENTISCLDLYSKEELHLIVDFICDKGWWRTYKAYPIQEHMLECMKCPIAGSKELE